MKKPQGVDGGGKQWVCWWSKDSNNPGWLRLQHIYQNKPEALKQLKWSAWYYEALSRDRGAFILGKPFPDLHHGKAGTKGSERAAWYWRDRTMKVIREIRGKNGSNSSAFAPADEVDAVMTANWGRPLDGHSMEVWVAVTPTIMCGEAGLKLNLARGDKEILLAFRKRVFGKFGRVAETNAAIATFRKSLAGFRKSHGIPNPGKDWDKGPPWRDLDAMDNRSKPLPDRVRKAQQRARDACKEFEEKAPGLVDSIVRWGQIRSRRKASQQ